MPKKRVSKAKEKRISVSKKSSKKASREPQTMDELLAAFGGDIKGFVRGDKVEGVVVEITKNRVVIDIGGKSEGVVAEKAFKEAESYISTLKVGDRIRASVIIPETPEGFTILSLREAARDSVWKKVENALKKTTPILVEVSQVNPSGLMVNIGGLTGFIPKSQLGKQMPKNFQSLIGKRIEVAVIDADRASKKIVLSEKEISEKEEIELVRKLINKVKEGSVYEGTVSSIYDFGCFVKIDVDGKTKKTKAELEGLVHISELSWDKVSQVADIVSVGDKVKVKVIGKTNGKLAFSIKQAQKDPWEDMAKKYKKDKKVKGKVVRLTDFGLFVSLEPGVEGLVHMTKIPPGKKFTRGDEVNVYIEDVDSKNRRLSLGLVLIEKPVGYK